MYLPRPTLLPSFLREVFATRTLQREPESSLVMEDPDEVKAYVEGGKNNTMAATYIFINSHVSQVIQGRQRVLDLGCGPATLLCQIAMTNPTIQFVGADLSENMIAQGNALIARLGLTNVTLVQADITQLSQFSDGEFDGVISTFAVHHLPTQDHLTRCFKEIRRLLSPGGAIFLIDFGRLKNIQSVIQVAYLNSEDDPYLFTLDKERSMRAAFTLQDFQRLCREVLPIDCAVFSTAKVPMLVMLCTPAKGVAVSMEKFFQDKRLKLAQKYRNDLDDMRFFFHLNGMKNDLFGPLIPGASQWAKLKMLDFAEVPMLRGLQTSQWMRMWGIARLATKVATATLRYGMAQWRKNEPQEPLRIQFHNRLATVFEEEIGVLKGPCMKFAQIASYMTFDLPPVIRAALQPLQSTSAPWDGAAIRKVVEKELRQPMAALFKEWNDVPLAAASISQLHLARLHNDQLVVVKVRYPGMLRAIRSDFFLIRRLAWLLKKNWGLKNTAELLKEMETLLLTECDFVQAGAFQEEFRHLFRDDPEIVIPKVYANYSTSAVLTMDYVDGKNYEQFKATSTQEEKNLAATIMWRMAAQSINTHSLYNADPHPGNYVFLEGKVAFLDFGFTRRFSPHFMNLWKAQSLAGCAQDFEEFKNINRQLGYEVPGKTFDHRALFDLYNDVIYQSWKEDRPFRFTKEFVNQEIQGLMQHFRAAGDSLQMPVEFVAILRLLAGQHAIFADLQAQANWHELVFPLLQVLTPVPHEAIKKQGVKRPVYAAYEPVVAPPQ